MVKKKNKVSILRVSRWIIGALMVGLVGYIGWAHQNAGGDPLDSYCPFGAVETALTSATSGGKLVSLVSFTDIVLFVIVIIVTLIAGGVFCGWLCPMGTVQDWIFKLGQKLGFKERKIPVKVDKYLVWLKYVVLALIMFATYKAVKLVFVEFDPYRAIFHMSIETEIAIILIGLIIILSLLFRRFWCKYLCPLGAIVLPLSKLGLIKVRKNDACTGCNLCMKNCPMTLQNIGDVGCNNCMECITDCPSASKSIDVKIGRKNINVSHAIIPIVGVTLAVVLVLAAIGTGTWDTANAIENTAMPPNSEAFFNYPEVEKVVFCTSSIEGIARVYDFTPAEIFTALGTDPSQSPTKSVKAVTADNNITEEFVKETIDKMVRDRGTLNTRN
jgi:polyferredoxin